MGLVSLGKKTVAVAGNPVVLSATPLNANALYFQALSTNTGKIYIGSSALVKATLAGCFRVLGIPTATGELVEWDVPSHVFTAPFDLGAIFIDADVGTEGVLVAVLV